MEEKHLNVINLALYSSHPPINHESRHDSYPQFPRSLLGARGLQTRSDKKKRKRLHFKSLALLKHARLIRIIVFSKDLVTKEMLET